MGAVGRPLPHDLAATVRAGLGRGVDGAERLRGGSKKGVYRLRLDDGSTVVAYVWAEAEDYWPQAVRGADDADPLSHSSGLRLFEAAHRRLTALGVRTPRLYEVSRSGDGDGDRGADVALVEDVPGPNLEALLDADPAAARRPLERLAEVLDTLRSDTGPGVGKVALLDEHVNGHQVQHVDEHAPARTAEALVLARALADLDEAAARDTRMAAARDRLAERLHERVERVPRRARHGLVHGELGPDHVLVGADGEPVLIDIEGLMRFDVEWEHAFLRIRFGTHYELLRPRGLDEHRLALYDLAMRLSLVAGPLRLLDGGFPDRAGMLAIVEHNLRAALAAAATAWRDPKGAPSPLSRAAAPGAATPG